MVCAIAMIIQKILPMKRMVEGLMFYRSWRIQFITGILQTSIMFIIVKMFGIIEV